MNFLDHYFAAVYNKLEADALLFNRRLPHTGIVGSENESALANLLRSFLPPRFGVEHSGIVIDRHGAESRQCDIIIYDAELFPTYLRKVFPIELVYGVIEVKTNLTSREAKSALENLEALWRLDFRPLLTPGALTEAREKGHQAEPPFGMIFSYRSEPKRFDAFADWFPFKSVFRGQQLRSRGGSRKFPEIRTLTVGALDKGIIKMESTNGHVSRWAMVAHEGCQSTVFETSIDGQVVPIDPAKVLFSFLERLWQILDQRRIHPGFDVRSYLSYEMDTFIDQSRCEQAPEDGYSS